MKKPTSLQRYDDAVAFLETLPKINKDNYMESLGSDKGFYLSRLRYLLDLVGNPENFTPNYIHVGGTSGKGTVTKTLTENLIANGEGTGSYMSPHITTTTERFWANGKLISMSDYADLIEWIKPALHTCLVKSPYGLPSYFEIQVAIALEFFRLEKCEWVVLEVGCGGEFDATNVIPPPKAAVITNIGLDHMHLLGETKAEIAETKSGIIKKGSLVFTGEKSPRLQHIIKDAANKQGAALQIVEGGNEELVEAVLHGLGFKKKVSHPPLPGRFEIIQKNPTVVLDVAHNPDKIAYLVRKWKIEMGKIKPHILFAVADNKNYKEMLRILVPLARTMSFSTFSASDRICANPAELEKIARAFNKNLKTQVFLNSSEALDTILKKTKKNEPVLATGSFFLIGDLRPEWISEKEILQSRSSL